MKFLVDAQVSPKLCRILSEHGHDAVHVSAMPLANATPDRDVTAKAEAEGRIVLSKNDDFAKSRAATGRPSKLLWIRVGNTPNRLLFELVERHLDDIVAGFDSGGCIELHESMLVIRA